MDKDYQYIHRYMCITRMSLVDSHCDNGRCVLRRYVNFILYYLKTQPGGEKA